MDYDINTLWIVSLIPPRIGHKWKRGIYDAYVHHFVNEVYEQHLAKGLSCSSNWHFWFTKTAYSIFVTLWQPKEGHTKCLLPLVRNRIIPFSEFIPYRTHSQKKMKQFFINRIFHNHTLHTKVHHMILNIYIWRYIPFKQSNLFSINLSYICFSWCL